jgi:hypothetical protein
MRATHTTWLASAALRDDAGNVICGTVSVEITTARKRSGTAAQRSQDRAIIEDQTEFLIRFKVDGTLTPSTMPIAGTSTNARRLNTPFFSWYNPNRRRCWTILSSSPENPVATIQKDIRPDGQVRYQQWTDRAFSM